MVNRMLLFLWLSLSFFSVSLANPLHNESMIPLDRRMDLVSEISLPSKEPSPVPTYIPITSEWRLVVATPTVRIWENSLPVRPRSLFFRSPPSGMELRQRTSQEQNWKRLKKEPTINECQRRKGRTHGFLHRNHYWFVDRQMKDHRNRGNMLFPIKRRKNEKFPFEYMKKIRSP